MKLKFIPLAVFFGAFALLLMSNDDGYTNHSGDCRTGAISSNVSCGQTGSGCHGGTTSTPGIRVSIELDSAGTPVSTYYPGFIYTIKMTGTNTTSDNLPVFGFGISTVKAAGAGTSSAVQAGTFSGMLPNGVQNSIELFRNTTVIEHLTPLPKTTGTGTAGTTYVISVNWTAPAAGTGSVKLLAVLNACDGNDQESSADKFNNTSTTISEAGGPNAISELSRDLGGVNVYPTLMTSTLTTAFDLEKDAKVTVDVLNLNGQLVRTLLSDEAMSAGTQTRTHSVSDLATGVYLVRISAAGHTAVSKVVKQ